MANNQQVDNELSKKQMEEESSIVLPVATRDYIVNIKHVQNRDMIYELFENPQFNQLMQNKTLFVNLKADIETNKRVVLKKKKAPIPYIINSFIFYTSFLSKADIKLKKDSKSWQLMGAVDPDTKLPLDKDGFEFRKLIEELETFHKKLAVYDDSPTNKEMNKNKTSELRKGVIAFAQNMLTSCYKNEEKPPIVNLNDNDEYVMACQELYKHHANFQSKSDNFKLFLKRHKLIKAVEEQDVNRNNSVAEKRKAAVPQKISNKRRLTDDMVSDIVDE
ncbi:39k [Matsumuraeses phaseoli granulovirus]|uniref:39k n=1 Tax=Matsumuraeses phaseoli granulovirus TaxID=2760664 RepID=A0AAE7SXP6_9BBAC|nr:39k [Matsumuraeses phaseoli granulovirus]QOD40013.1 39k [Matsumuraeses phaseoli granulovirus]